MLFFPVSLPSRVSLKRFASFPIALSSIVGAPSASTANERGSSKGASIKDLLHSIFFLGNSKSKDAPEKGFHSCSLPLPPCFRLSGFRCSIFSYIIPVGSRISLRAELSLGVSVSGLLTALRKHCSRSLLPNQLP